MADIITRDDLPEDGEPERRKAGADDKQYAVGYGKPPLHGQFQPGNKRGKGRQKGSKNLKSIVINALDMKTAAKVDGEIRKLTKMELATHQLANKAAGGDLKAIDSVINLYERFGPQEDPAGPAPEQTRANLATLRDYLGLMDMFGDDEGEGADA